MTLPQEFLQEIASRRLGHRIWLEIEGIPDAIGNFQADESWWSELPQREKYSRVLDLASEVPNFSSQRLDHAGGRVSLGTCGFVAAERDGVLHRLFATRRPGIRAALQYDLTRETTLAALQITQEQWEKLPSEMHYLLGQRNNVETTNEFVGSIPTEESCSRCPDEMLLTFSRALFVSYLTLKSLNRTRTCFREGSD